MDAWIEVKQFPVEQDLTGLTRFLHERHIEHRISEAAGRQLLSVRHPDLVAPIVELLESIERGETVLEPRLEERPSQESQPSSIPLMTQLHYFPVVFVLLACSAVGFFIATYAQDWLRYFTFQDFNNRYYIPLEESLAAGEYWRLITPTFLHFGAMHFLFNAVLLWWFGQRLETRMGHSEFIVFFLVTALAANLGQYWWTGSANFGGISGVIYAFVGLVFVMKFASPWVVSDIQMSLLWFMLGWLVLCMTGIVDMFMAGGGVANAAHLAGLLAGLGYGFVRVGFARVLRR